MAHISSEVVEPTVSKFPNTDCTRCTCDNNGRVSVTITATHEESENLRNWYCKIVQPS